MQFIRNRLATGNKPERAIKLGLIAILTSPRFLYLDEGNEQLGSALAPHELAARLSYFLWSSMPDDALFTAATSGDLNDEGLKQAVDRMLADDRINRFIDDFSRQWLQLHRVGMFPPDKKLYAVYDDWLETSMRQEPVEYFREMLKLREPRHVLGVLDMLYRVLFERGQLRLAPFDTPAVAGMGASNTLVHMDWCRPRLSAIF